MANVLRGVISQRLHPARRRRARGSGRGDGQHRTHRRDDPRLGQDRRDHEGDRGRPRAPDMQTLPAAPRPARRSTGSSTRRPPPPRPRTATTSSSRSAVRSAPSRPPAEAAENEHRRRRPESACARTGAHNLRVRAHEACVARSARRRARARRSAGAGEAGHVHRLSRGRPTLPSAEMPNAPGDIAFPAAHLDAAREPDRRLTYAELLALWRQAGDAYGVPWELLAAINEVESNVRLQHGAELRGRGRLDAVHALDLGSLGRSTRTVTASPIPGIRPTPCSPLRATWPRPARTRTSPARCGPTTTRTSTSPLVLDLAGAVSDEPAARADACSRTFRDRSTTVRPTSRRSWRRRRDARRRSGSGSARSRRRSRRELRALLVAEQATRRPGRSATGAFEGARAATSRASTRTSRISTPSSPSTRDELDLVQEQIAAIEQTISEEQSDARHERHRGPDRRPADAEASAVIDYALRQLGIPYHWGGNHGVALEDMMLRDAFDPGRVRLLEPPRLVVRQGRRHLHRRLDGHPVGVRRHRARSHARSRAPPRAEARRRAASWPAT